jgi:hypothetical protein
MDDFGRSMEKWKQDFLLLTFLQQYPAFRGKDNITLWVTKEN